MKSPRSRPRPSVRDASRRLTGILGRASRLGVHADSLLSTPLLRQACGAQKADGYALLAPALLTLFAGIVVLIVACGHAELNPCQANSSEEIHIKTMSWRLPVDGRMEGLEDVALSGGDLDLEDLDDPPHWQQRARR